MTAQGKPENEAARSLSAQASRGVLWNLVLVPAVAAVALASSAVVARALSNESYRLYGLAMASVTSLLLWSDLGLTSTVARFTPSLRARGEPAVRWFLKAAGRLRLGAVLVLVTILLALRETEWLQDVLPFQGLQVLLIATIASLQSASRVNEYYLTGLLDRKGIGVIQLIASLVQPMLVVGAAVLGRGVTGILVALAVAAAVELSLFTFRMRTTVPGHVKGQPRTLEIPGEMRREAFRFAGITYAEKIANYLASATFVIFLIAGFGRVEEVALFAVAGEFVTRVVSLLTIPFSGIALPVFSTLDARPDREESRVALRLYIVLLVLIFMPAAALLTSLSNWLVTLIYSPRYMAAASILLALVPFVFVEYTVYSALLAALMTRKKYLPVLASKAPLLASLLALVWVIPRWGAVGAAATFGCARLLSALLLLRAGLREYQFRFPSAFVGRVAVASLAGAIAARVFASTSEASWLLLTLAVGLGVVVFLAAFKMLGGVDPADRARIERGLPELEHVVSFLL